MTDQPGPEFLTAEQAAARIGGTVTAQTLRTWRAKRQGPPHIRLGRDAVYPRDLLEQFIRALRETATTAAGG